jgi:hypothetical protein
VDAGVPQDMLVPIGYGGAVPLGADAERNDRVVIDLHVAEKVFAGKSSDCG